MTRVVERFAEIAEDFKIFGPMLQDQAAARAEQRHLAADVEKVVHGLEQLERRLEGGKRERIAGQQARKEEWEAAIIERKAEMERDKMERDKQHREMRTKVVQATLA